MRVLVQRVTEASVSIKGKSDTLRCIKQGFVLLVGMTHNDTYEDVVYCANKVSKLRVFEDDNQKMNLDITSIKGDMLSISQFTLYANTQKGNRPSFVDALAPNKAQQLFDQFNQLLQSKDIPVQTGYFGEHMIVNIVNDGPVTVMIDSKQ